jgi:hypothetical protein
VVEHLRSVPGQLRCGREALAEMLDREPSRLRVAVAFVTMSGVQILSEVLEVWSGELELTEGGMSSNDE